MCIRFIPVEVVCHADLADIKKAAKTLIEQHFPAEESSPSVSFAVFYEHRASVKLDRMEVINSIVDEIPQVIRHCLRLQRHGSPDNIFNVHGISSSTLLAPMSITSQQICYFLNYRSDRHGLRNLFDPAQRGFFKSLLTFLSLFRVNLT